MKPARILGFRCAPADSSAARFAGRYAEALNATGWRALISGRRGVFLFLKDGGRGECLELPDETGVVVGPLFSGAGRPLRQKDIDVTLAARWCESGGRALVDEHWGNWLAVLHDRGRDCLHIVRDPMGAGACFIASTPWSLVFFTHAADYVSLFPDCVADLDYLKAFLASPRLVSRRTAILGVEETPAGARLTIGRDGEHSERLWRPEPRGPQIRPDEFDAAAARLRDLVRQCACAWITSNCSILHRLSGGLDSSVALAALSQAETRASIVCVNEFPTRAPEGDERLIAREVAKAFGARLIELAIQPEDVVYERILSQEVSAKPSLSELSFAGRAFADLVADGTFGLLTSGQGGDQVMHRSRTPEIAADAVRDGLSIRAALDTACAVARLARRPVWDVFAAQLRHGFTRLPYDPSAGLVSENPLAGADAVALAQRYWREHDLMSHARRAPPARARRMLRISDLQFYHNPSVLTETMPNALILASQPVVEFCLRIPPYVMTADGRDRALERAAFADLLPPSVSQRSLKGDTTRHFTAVLEKNLGFIRDVLTCGRLADEGLINRQALDEALTRTRIADGKIASGLSQCLTAELWLRRFEEARRAARGGHATG